MGATDARPRVPDGLEEAAARGMAVAFHAAADPERVAIVCPRGDLTYGALNDRANRLVRALRRRGVGVGDAVALLCTNRLEFVEVYVATQRAGMRLTPVNWHLTGPEAGYIVGDCDAKAVIADARFADVAAGATRDVPALRARFAVGGPIEGFERYDDVLAAEEGSDVDDPSQGTTMLYTSGTTGRPKGVERRDGMSVKATAGIVMHGYRDGDVHLCTGPLYHAAPLLFSLSVPLVAGVTIVVMDGWDAARALELITEHGVTHTHMVPTMFHRLLALPDDVRANAELGSVRSVWHGAAPCPVPVKRGIIEWFGPIVNEYYSATEGMGTFVDSRTWLEHPGTVGRPYPADQVVIGDDEGTPLPAGEVGMVWLKAATIGRFEYHGDPAKTDATYRGDYFTVGDLGYLDADGFLYLTDRSADLVISGGVNIYPAEVDAVLLEHPAVADVATIGVPSDEWGEEVKAVVELRDPSGAGPELEAELIGFCRDRLAHYKCPHSVDFVDELPRSDTGKVYRRRLRDRYRASAGG
jgi:long-chain acyl-CoA synthetase